MFNRNWPRWLSASVNTHFTPLTELEGIDVFIEGSVRQTADWDNFIEVRMDGPYWRETTKNDFTLKIEVNILTQHTIRPNQNLYQAQITDGIVGEYLTTIPVYKLGGEEGDDETQVGCLTLESNPASRDWTKHNEFGQVETKTKLRQKSVEAHYHIELRGV
jgi:hypothetical protein